MNLQELFKEYYSKAKAVDAKEYVNSAKTSINSFSSLLEKRRQKATLKKQEEDATKNADEKPSETDKAK